MSPTDAKTILIVEDEALVRMIGCDILKDDGFRVIEAADASEALQQLQADAEILLMFTDVNMPGSLDGLGLAKLVHDRWPRVKILVASGDVRPRPDELPDEGLFISKPYLAAEMLALVRGLATA